MLQGIAAPGNGDQAHFAQAVDNIELGFRELLPQEQHLLFRDRSAADDALLQALDCRPGTGRAGRHAQQQGRH